MEVKFKEERNSGYSKWKSIALKGIVDNDKEEDEAVIELILLMKRFKKWTRKHENPTMNQRIKTKLTKVLDDSKEEDIICYRFNKPGHIKPNCPLNQLNKGNKKKKKFCCYVGRYRRRSGEFRFRKRKGRPAFHG